ncbi:MAG: family 78 glycoside hydrolase catalytic domain, partial [Bryobacteraceae bacterium]
MRILAGIAWLAGSCAFGAAGIQAPDRLRCEYLENPPVIDVPSPRFSWIPKHEGKSQIQTAYQVLVTSEAGANVWNSGKVASRATAQIPYAGPALHSNRQYRWRVRYWDREGQASAYSQSASFTTGLLQPGDWKARWIEGGNELQHQFTIAGSLRRARAFVSAVGLYELRINGRRVGNAVLDPAWTDYRKRALYSAYDVRPLLHAGRNTIEIRLGKGRAETSAALLQLHIAGSAGETVIASGFDWLCRDGAVRSASLYDGEVDDARPVSEPWRPVALSSKTPATVSAQMIQPIEVTETIVPRQLSPGIYDVGQLISGWARIAVKGPAGAEVKLRFAETLLPDGSLDRSTLRAAKAEDTYILRGGGVETWEPAFTYHGFRYIEATGAPIRGIEARVVHSAVGGVGTFRSSSDLLNRIEQAIDWTIRTNLHGIPTDNNQRDERLGWLGDAHLAAHVSSLHFDLAAFYTKFLRDI